MFKSNSVCCRKGLGNPLEHFPSTIQLQLGFITPQGRLTIACKRGWVVASGISADIMQSTSSAVRNLSSVAKFTKR